MLNSSSIVTNTPSHRTPPSRSSDLELNILSWAGSNVHCQLGLKPRPSGPGTVPGKIVTIALAIERDLKDFSSDKHSIKFVLFSCCCRKHPHGRFGGTVFKTDRAAQI